MPTIPELLTDLRKSWDDAKAVSRVGRELQDRNRLPQAIHALERALELDSSDVEAWASLSFAHFRNWSPDRGEEVLRKGIEATDDDGLRTFLHDFTSDEEEKARLASEVEGTKHLGARANLLGNRFYAGEVDEALAGLRELVRENPDELDPAQTLAWLLIGAARQERIDDDALVEEAVPLIDGLIVRDPERISAHGMKVQLHVARKDWPAVLGVTGAVLQVFPDEETVMQWRGQAFAESGDVDRAAHWYSRAIGAKPSFAGARRDLGKLLEREGKAGLAEEVFREIPQASPDYPLGPVSLALFLARQGQWDEAEKLVIEAWPNLPDWAKGMVRNQPDAADLMARDAVKATIGAGEEE